MQVNIDHTPLVYSGKLSSILRHSCLEERLYQRCLEGFVLSGAEGEGFIKWKYIENETPQLKQHFETMRDLCHDSSAVDNVERLQRLCSFSKNVITKMQDTELDPLLQLYFDELGKEILQHLNKAQKEGHFTYNLALQQTAEEIFSSYQNYLDDDIYLDPTLFIPIKNQIQKDLKVFHRLQQYETFSN